MCALCLLSRHLSSAGNDLRGYWVQLRDVEHLLIAGLAPLIFVLHPHHHCVLQLVIPTCLLLKEPILGVMTAMDHWALLIMGITHMVWVSVLWNIMNCVGEVLKMGKTRVATFGKVVLQITPLQKRTQILLSTLCQYLMNNLIQVSTVLRVKDVLKHRHR